MTDILFYHLEKQPLDAVLPSLLEKTLERGWRAVIESDNKERLSTLDAHLWTYSDESFLPHCLSTADDAPDTPIVLCETDENINNAQVRFFIDGANPKNIDTYERIVVMFDGRDDEALNRARDLWKSYQSGDNAPTYWQQTDQGGWKKKA